MKDVLSLPFDQYQRYRLVADLVDEIRGDKPLAVLDVGGRTALLRAFLPQDDVTLVDLEDSSEPGLVLGDGSRLPFRDGAFDVVAGFDTLEHVPPARREAFVSECARVSRGYVFLAGPYRAPEVDEAEELLKSFLFEKLGLEHRYLEEHRANGLPVRQDVELQLQGLGARVESFGHGNLDRWLALMCMEMYMDHDPGLRPVAERFFRFYNRALFASDHAAPVYRHVVAAALGEARLPQGRTLALEPPVAPPGTVKCITELGLELVAFDREKDVWNVEFERLSGVIADLEKDLAEHKQRLAETEADLASHEETLAEEQAAHHKALKEHAEEKKTLETDLREHMRSLAEARAQNEKATREFAETRAALDEDLREHVRAFAEAQGEHERSAAERAVTEADLRAQIQDQQRTRADLERHLSETEAGAARIQDDLAVARQECESMGAHIVHLESVITELEATLRHRGENLKRAFTRKKTH